MDDRLERLRDRAHSQIIAIFKFAQNISETTTLDAIKTRLEILQSRYQTFNEIEIQLFDNANYKSITEEVDENYYKARELLEHACRSLGKPDNNKGQDLNTTLENFIDQQKTFYEGVNTANHVRLPKINIDPFSGDYKNWASFHDLFSTTVHNNHNISDVHKLQMLKGLLKGEAASLVRHFSITENNYVEAWQKLCNRYNKVTPIVTSLVQSFMEQKPCANSTGKELRRISETSDEIIRGLRVLGPNAESRDPWLIHITLGKIDEESKRLWAVESVEKNNITFENLLQFLSKRCDALEICEATNKRVTRTSAKTFLSAHSSYSYECVVCKEQHPLFKCPEFRNLIVDERCKIISENNLCTNCLKKGHSVPKCFTKSSCQICKKRHHTLIHSSNNVTDVKRPSTTHHATIIDSKSEPHYIHELPQIETTHTSNELTQDFKSQNDSHVLHTLFTSITTVLPTALIYIESRTGKLQLFRALLDSGSQTSFVTESCAKSLGLRRSHASLSVYGLASTPAGQTKGTIDMTIYSRINQNYKTKVKAHIIHNISKLLPTKSLSFCKPLPKINLADPHFHKPSKIDVLLGADIFFEILNPEKRVSDGIPILQSSKLGWLVAGSYTNALPTVNNFHATTDAVIKVSDDDLHHQIRKFWEMEEVCPQNNTSQNIHECEQFYEQTTIRSKNGQFIVKLPFKTPALSLGRSYEAAYQRLLAMERKFARSPEFYKEYKSFMDEYKYLGHMNNIAASEIPTKDDQKYYLPHHAVIKPGSSTTKLRVVFDASCKTTSGLSLNDIMQIDPNIQIASCQQFY